MKRLRRWWRDFTAVPFDLAMLYNISHGSSYDLTYVPTLVSWVRNYARDIYYYDVDESSFAVSEEQQETLRSFLNFLPDTTLWPRNDSGNPELKVRSSMGNVGATITVHGQVSPGSLWAEVKLVIEDIVEKYGEALRYAFEEYPNEAIFEFVKAVRLDVGALRIITDRRSSLISSVSTEMGYLAEREPLMDTAFPGFRDAWRATRVEGPNGEANTWGQPEPNIARVWRVLTTLRSRVDAYEQDDRPTAWRDWYRANAYGLPEGQRINSRNFFPGFHDGAVWYEHTFVDAYMFIRRHLTSGSIVKEKFEVMSGLIYDVAPLAYPNTPGSIAEYLTVAELREKHPLVRGIIDTMKMYVTE